MYRISRVGLAIALVLTSRMECSSLLPLQILWQLFREWDELPAAEIWSENLGNAYTLRTNINI
jgi:hypothetical protein